VDADLRRHDGVILADPNRGRIDPARSGRPDPAADADLMALLGPRASSEVSVAGPADPVLVPDRVARETKRNLGNLQKSSLDLLP